MLLRSSSTPILGSLVSSYSESPNHHSHDFNSPKHQLPKKFPPHQTPPLNLFTSSPSSTLHADFTGENRVKTHGFRRVQSEGNLDELLSESFSTFEELNQQHFNPTKFSRKPHCSVLESIPSFLEHGTRRYEEEDDEDEEEESVEVEECENVDSEMSGAWVKNKEHVYGNGYVESKMHLAMGLGVMSGGFNGGGGLKGAGTGGDADDGANMEEYYQRMMAENPGNPLFLSNYAQFLHQSKELEKAEEYYSRALLIDSGDGETLSKYAQLTWELHHDHKRASSYFERAVQAAPQDSHVLAAYAGFLWETDEEEEEEEEEEADSDTLCTNHAIRHDGTLATVSH